MSVPDRDEVALRSDLAAAVGAANVLADAERIERYRRDWTGRYGGPTPAVVRPGTTEEVAALIEVCRRHGAAIVAQGGNTGLVGGGVPRAGEVVLSLARLDRVGPVDTGTRAVTVGAGATLAAVQAAARASGLRYAVDLAARDSATIGGTIATNAGGSAVLRHGMTDRQLLGVDAVLGSGHRVGNLERPPKDNTGYRWPGVLCGSEGTLGVVTAARLALVHAPSHCAVGLVAFDSVDRAVAAAGALRHGLEALDALELMCDDGVALVCDAFGRPPPFDRSWPAYLLVEVADDDDPLPSLGAAVAGLAGVTDSAVGVDDAAAARLRRYREDHTPAVNTMGPPIKLDVSVPMAAMAELIVAARRIAAGARPAARCTVFGHAGDGNLHVNLTGPAAGDEALAAALSEQVLEATAALGGSISAEHGIGTAKRRWLHLARTPSDIAAMGALKSALDPDGIMNPGVLLP